MLKGSDSSSVEQIKQANLKMDCLRLLEILEHCKKSGPQAALDLFQLRSSNEQYYSKKCTKIIHILFDVKKQPKQNFKAIEEIDGEIVPETTDMEKCSNFLPAHLSSICHVGMWAVTLHRQHQHKNAAILRQKLLLGFTFYQITLIKKVSNRRAHKLLG